MFTQFKWVITSLVAALFLTTPIAVSAQGKFTFTIIRDGNPEDEKLVDYIEKNGTFTKIIDTLNKTLVIPYNIDIVLTNSKYGPHYEPGKKLIVLDYGDQRWAAQQFDKHYEEEDSDEESRQDYLNNITYLVFIMN